MDTNTGKLYPSLQDAVDVGLDREDIIELNPDQLTPKQTDGMQVSLKDHRSKAGKILTENRKRKLKRRGKLS